MTIATLRSISVIASLTITAVSNEGASAQYLGYFIDGTWREVQLDRSIQESQAKYVNGQLWCTPISMSGGGVRTGILMDYPLKRLRHLSFVCSPTVVFTQLSGRFHFSSETPPFPTNIVYPLNGSGYSDKGFRVQNVFSTKGSVALKVRVARGLVIRLGASVYIPVYASQRTQWTRTIKDDLGQEYVYEHDETVSGKPEVLYYGGSWPLIIEGFAEMGYEFKNGIGLFIRGSRSPEMSRSLPYNTIPRMESNWRTYAFGFGICFQIVRSIPASNWGGVKPVSTEEARELRRARKATNARVQDTMPMVQPPSAAPVLVTPPPPVDALLPVPPQDTAITFADTALRATADPVHEGMVPPVVPTPRSEAPAVQDAQYAGCAVALERTDGTVTQVRSEEVGSAPPASSTALRVQWAGRADGKRWLWLRLLPASGAPPPLVRATLAWSDGRRLVIASDLRPAEAEVRPDGSTWHGMQLTDQEWRAVGEQMPNELALVTKSGPLQVVWMAEERRTLEEQRACLDQWFLANSSAAIRTGARSPIGSGTMPPVQAQHLGDTKQEVDLSGGAAVTNVAAPPPGQHVQQDSLSTIAGTTTRSPDEGRLAYKVITEHPEDFAAVSVYTLLHEFSTPFALDTFRVVTRHGPMGGLKHELWISTLTGATYREELYPVPLEGASDAGRTTGEEMEMLRVRMALAPGAFQPNPISVDDWRLSGARAGRDLLYDLSIAEFDSVFFEKPAIGFRFQSDAETRRELVYSSTLRRIVNVAPQ